MRLSFLNWQQQHALRRVIYEELKIENGAEVSAIPMHVKAERPIHELRVRNRQPLEGLQWIVCKYFMDSMGRIHGSRLDQLEAKW